MALLEMDIEPPSPKVKSKSFKEAVAALKDVSQFWRVVDIYDGVSDRQSSRAAKVWLVQCVRFTISAI